jgi:hypothetical protein
VQEGWDGSIKGIVSYDLGALFLFHSKDMKRVTSPDQVYFLFYLGFHI